MAPEPTAWASRIIGYGEEPPDQFLAHDLNWRTHPQAQQAALLGSLSELGWIQNVIVSKRSGKIVDGHARVMLALRHDQPTVPVTYVDLSPEEEALALATIDPISAMAGADAAQLDALLREVSTGDAAVQALLADLHAKEVAADHYQPKSLDDLAAEFGDPDDAAYWPEVRLKVPPDVYAAYREALDACDGDTDEARFADLVARAAVPA